MTYRAAAVEDFGRAGRADPATGRTREPLDAEELFTPEEVAELFRVSPKTVTRWANGGKFRAGTIIRTLGGHRRYRANAVRELLQPEHEAGQL